MSSKPTGKKPSKPQPKPVAKDSSPAKTESKTSSKRPVKAAKAPSEKATSNEDEPFAVDQAAMSNAIPLRPKPTKGRTYEVVCPMCETPGYTSLKAGGREVKCANPKCLVPIFTCPEPPPAPVEEPPPEPAGLSTTQLGVISTVALIAIGAGIWFFVLKDNTSLPEGPPVNPGVANSGKTEEPNPEDEIKNNDSKETKPVQPQGPDLVKLRQEAPAIMLETSNWPTGRKIQRPKPLRVQDIALAYANLGELQKAEEQLDRLANFSDDSPHYRVLPWVEIGWKQLAREESASQAADNALKFAEDIPDSHHESWLEAVSLAALLNATGSGDKAPSLMERNFGPDADQELWADLMAVTLDHSFDLDKTEEVRSLVTPESPAWSGVVWQLVFHDAITEGLNWAKRDPNRSDENKAAIIRGEAMIEWADAVVARSLAMQQPADYAALDSALQELPKPLSDIATARAYSRIGQRYAISGDEKTAGDLLSKAETALATFPKKTPMPEPDLRTIYNGDFPNTPFNTQMAVAAFEVGRLQAKLGQQEEAWNSVEQGLDILRSESLPESTASRLAAQVKSKFEADILKSQLRGELSLGSEEKARQAFRTYQTNVNNLKKQAESRLDLQVDLLSKASEWGLLDQVAQEILATPTDRPQDSYLKTDLPWAVVTHDSVKDSEPALALMENLKSQRVSKPKGQALLENAKEWTKEQNYNKVVDGLGQTSAPLPSAVRKRYLLRLFTQQVKKGHTDAVLNSLLTLFNRDPFLGEDAAELIVAFATEQGQGSLIWQELKSTSWSATQRIAAFRGFIEAATPLVEEAPETPETD